MALNRYLYPQKGTNVVQQVTLHTRVSIGAAGAVTGILSGYGLTVTKNVGAGSYTVTIDGSSTVSAVVHAMANVMFSPYSATDHVLPVSTAVSTTGATFQCVQPNNGAAGNPPSGSELAISLVCTLSAVPA